MDIKVGGNVVPAIVLKRSGNGAYACVKGAEMLMTLLSRELAVDALNLESGEIVQVAMAEGKVVVVKGVDPELARDMSRKAIAKAMASSRRGAGA